MYKSVLDALNMATALLTGKKVSASEEKVGTIVPSAGRLVDMTAFFATLELISRSTAEDAPELHKEGLAMAHKLQHEYVVDVNQFIVPVLDGWGLRAFKTKWAQLSKPKKEEEAYADRAMFVIAVLSKLRSKQNIMHSIFTDGRVFASAKSLSGLPDLTTSEEQLKLLATVRPVGHMATARSWMKRTFTVLGVDTPEFEDVISDVSMAEDLGQQLRNIDVAITNAQTNEAVEALGAQREAVVSLIHEAASQSVNPQAVLTTAATAAASAKFNYKTKTGRELMLSPEQEDAMMVRGKSIIAAGAGSGKTRVMAGKVVYHIKELGAKPSQFIATSFSNKSAHELIDRVKKYGGANLLEDGPSSEGFGTTHRVAGTIIRKYGGPAARDEKPLGSSGQTTLLRMAMEQVKLSPTLPVRSPVSRSFFEEPKKEDEGAPMELPKLEEEPLQKAAKQALEKFGWKKNPQGVGSASNPPRFPAWKQDMVLDMLDKIASGKLKQPSPKQTPYVNDGLAAAGIEYRVGAPVSAAAKKSREAGPTTGESRFWKNPANKWFNLGVGEKGFIDDEGRAIGTKQIQLAISNWKANLITPEQAFNEKANKPSSAARPSVKDLLVATYAAYEWLKGNTPEYVGWRDHDDTLIKACQIMVANSTALAQLKSRYKYILVDEAQDLNAAQHLMFGLISGTYDPSTKAAYEDGRCSADTYTLIGDDKQCVAVDTMIATPSGQRRADELKPGDTVTAFRNGKNVAQKLRHVVESSWTWGYRIVTESGAALTMSPNHRLWATEPRTSEDQMVVYLMYRSDMGFRVGITNKGKVGQEDYHSSYGGRAFLEKAERLWVLSIVDSRDEALLQEQRTSLKYGIPTMVFNGEHRDLNQNRIEAIFQEFGRNGFRLLEDRHLSFKHPHWMSQSYSKHGRSRLVVNLVAHSGSNTQVATEWSGDQFDDKTAGLGVVHTKDDRRRLRRWFANYREALAFAEDTAERLGGSVSHKLSTPEGSLREVTASGLFTGMQVPVIDGEAFALETIVSIEKVDNKFVDLDVDDASNFYGNGILSHNSIYEFRGATPDKFINMSELVEGGQSFVTKMLDTNYRSGRVIVDAANHLMSHNKKQIPMTCKAHEDRKGIGVISARKTETHEDAARYAAETVRDFCEGEGAPMGYNDFGVAARTNAELFAFCVEMLKLGIPFRSKVNMFNNPTANSLLSWAALANCAPDDQATINEVVLNSYRAPNFNLNRMFNEQLQRKANGNNYLEYLKSGGWRNIYEGSQSWRNERYVKPYTDMLAAVKEKKGSPTEVLNFIMELRGPAIAAGKPGRSMLEDLVDETKKDPDSTDMLVEDAQTKVTDEDVRRLALAPIQPLLEVAANYQDLGPFMTYLNKLKKANDKQHKYDNPEEADYNEPAVVLDTVHGWKGLETKHIFVPMASGVFPHSKSMGDEDSLASERRLAYVAITRGQDNVTILCPSINHIGKPAGPSDFVGEACIPIEGQKKPGEEGSELKASFEDDFDDVNYYPWL